MQKEDHIKITDFEDPSALEPVSGSLFKTTSNAQERYVDGARVIQGYVEASNVNMVDSMMELVYLNRMYELNTKIISNRDVMLGKAIEMGRAQ